jgi:hypothetical protein
MVERRAEDDSREMIAVLNAVNDGCWLFDDCDGSSVKCCTKIVGPPSKILPSYLLFSRPHRSSQNPTPRWRHFYLFFTYNHPPPYKLKIIDTNNHQP